MADADGFDDAVDGLLVGFVEVVDGFEVEGEVVCGAAFVSVEEERVLRWCCGAAGQRTR